MGKPIETGLFLASLGQFSGGVNSDVPPIALPSTQLSYAENCTVRGNFVTQRSAWNDSTLSFSNAQVQTGFEDGLFQFGCYYSPDSGPESVVVSIGGRLYKVTPGGYNTADVIEVSIAGDSNSDTISQSFVWQGENYVFVNNGVDPTLIFSGNSSFRSDPGTVVGTTVGAVSMPAIDVPVAIALTAPYTGPLGYPLYLYPSAPAAASGAYLTATVQVSVESTGGYQCLLQNVDDTPGVSYPDGTIIYSSPGSPITLSKNTTINAGSYNNFYSLMALTEPYTQPGSITITDSNSLTHTFQIAQSQSRTVNGVFYLGIVLNGTYPYMYFSVGTKAFPSSGTPVPVAVLEGVFVSGDQGVKIEAVIEANYSGPDDQPVTIDGKNYTISKSAYTPTSSIYITPTASNVDAGTSIPSGSVLKTIPQLPIGTIGVYGLGRNWISLPDRTSYIASDIVGSSSGTLANKFRDSILNVTENNYLAGGGVFRVPSAGQQINAMRFPATLDSSLGQGPLQVLTQDTTFSCNAPVQRLEWQDMVNPIQTQSLVGGGALSHYSCVAVNGDLWFRADDGIRSLKLARQDFQVSYSNTPQSVEMNRVLLADDKSLLGHSSAVVFDNRLLMTASPVQSQGGVYHSKIIALNLDPNSSMRGKQPPVYDGAWNDRNVLQLIVGTFQNIKRCFAFTYDTETEKIGLAELQLTPLPGETQSLTDNGTTSIEWMFESPAIFYQEDTRKRELLRLCDGEMFVKDLVGTARFDVYYRPDYSSIWTPWHSWEVTDSPNFQPRMGLGTPTAVDSGDNTGRPSCAGYHFQVKVIVTGSCVVMGMNFFATTQPGTSIAPPVANDPPLTPKVA